MNFSPKKYTSYEFLEKQVKEAKRLYKEAQVLDMSLVDTTAVATDPKVAWYAEYAYWPLSKRDAGVQNVLEYMDYIFSMAKLRVSFNKHLKIYLEVRSTFEDTCNSVNSMVNMLVSSGTEAEEVP